MPFVMLLFGRVPDRVLHVPRRRSSRSSVLRPAPRAHGSPTATTATTAAHAHDAPAMMTVPLWVLALLAMAIGIVLRALDAGRSSWPRAG